MILLALRNLITEKTRFAFSAAGIGFAVFLITVMIGLYQGWNEKVGGFVERVDGDAWVAREGTTDFINAASILPVSLEAELEADDRVASASPMIDRLMAFKHGDKKVDVQLIGYDAASGVGGPVKIVKGRGDPSGNEIVIDEIAGRQYGVGVGDVLTTTNTDIEIVGISSGGNFAITQAAFMDYQVAAELLQMSGFTTFYIVSMEDVAAYDAWQSDFKTANPGRTVFTSKEFADATRHRILDTVVPILLLIIGLAFVVGIAITSLTIYTATVEHTREFGVMKAVGFNNLDLYKLVLMQSLLTGFLGFAFGATLTIIMSQFIDRVVATFILSVRPVDLLIVLGATLIMAIASSIVPARRAGSIDPAVVFRG